jgi:AcrR family transcriptional regulator
MMSALLFLLLSLTTFCCSHNTGDGEREPARNAERTAGCSGDSAGNDDGSTSDRESTGDRLTQTARVEFAQRGLRGATTKRIAGAAGLSEVTLFRHFATKKYLFTAVLAGYSSFSVFNERLAERLTWDLETDLKMIGSMFLGMTDASALAMLTSITEAIRNPEVRELVAEPPRRQLEFMARYFTEQINRGGCRPLPDVALTAQAFLALFFEHSVGKAVYVDDAPEPSETVDRLVTIFLHGIAA